MSEDIHTRAKQLILESSVAGISAADRDWLDAHLDGCSACAARAAAVDLAVLSLRSVPVRLNPAIVVATRRRVRLRAKQLHETRMPSVWLWPACAASWLWIALSAPWLWHGFAWAAGKMNIPSPLWQMSFALWWAMPALIAAGALGLRSLQGADALQLAESSGRNV